MSSVGGTLTGGGKLLQLLNAWRHGRAATFANPSQSTIEKAAWPTDAAVAEVARSGSEAPSLANHAWKRPDNLPRCSVDFESDGVMHPRSDEVNIP